MMKDYYQQSMRALQLAGMSERTQQCYTRSVRMLVDFYHKSPDLISEQELQDYFLYRKNKDNWSPATMRICYSGIKFFLSMCSSDSGTLWIWYGQKANDACLLYWASMRFDPSWKLSVRLKTKPTFTLSIPAVLDSMKPFIFRSATSIKNACAFTCIAAKAHRTDMFLCPSRHFTY